MYFETEILYPNDRDIVVYQTCPKLTKRLFGKNSKTIIVRAFLFDKKSIKNIGIENKNINIVKTERILEKNFRINMKEYFTQHPNVKSIMTGLIAIPLSGKQKLLNELIFLRDEHDHMEAKKTLELNLSELIDRKHKFCSDMPTMNIADCFRVLLIEYSNINFVTTLNPIRRLLDADVSSTEEFKLFNIKTLCYESGALKLIK